jgi:hypothetical protein
MLKVIGVRVFHHEVAFDSRWVDGPADTKVRNVGFHPGDVYNVIVTRRITPEELLAVNTFIQLSFPDARQVALYVYRDMKLAKQLGGVVDRAEQRFTHA